MATIDWDAERLKMAEPATWYQYPTLHPTNEDMRDTCNLCGERVETGELCADDGDRGVVHERCYQEWVEGEDR